MSGPAATTVAAAPSLRRKSGVSTSMVVAGVAARMARIVCAKCSAPPSARSSRSTDVMTTCASPSSATAAATLVGSALSNGPGSPVATLQKAQARVQVSPMIIMVAWLCAQHSPMLGQAASSHTVTSPCARSTRRVSPSRPPAAGTRTRIQSGFLRIGVSGLPAFSGCRGPRLSRMVTMPAILPRQVKPATTAPNANRSPSPLRGGARGGGNHHDIDDPSHKMFHVKQ